ncbi:NADH:flavin oxidoreductase [Pseudomonas deceptionensis]|uniref:2,4-dienoyl-CoA reductase n=1 Tax=Pseudomonas deceptionensis TaxID=882211 RepID=A0A0J6GA26_PSEDM|nr:NADH:flavin oxidoreductase [Pseudomonas deceptionensis]KMM78460.1 NADH:flavin oxidoreductase [Pseudomonas deceptionensis]SEE98074.1 2,4-dienoyl-CoA reductase [Pseudomonas deceptionensis]
MTGLKKTILSPHDINGAVSRNRLAVAPMTRVTATEEGLATQTMQDYYLRFAQGGFGLIITEGLYTDKAFSQGYPNQPGLADEEQAQVWAKINHELRAQGSLVFAQIMHAGALSQGSRYRTHTVGPSAVQPVGEQMSVYYGEGAYAMPVEITEAEIAQVIQGFADTAARAVETANFDGIEIHGANGYLLDQFLTAHTNLRKDRWGGDMTQRMSLLINVVTAVKEKVGQKVPVGVRISQGKVNDFKNKWLDGEGDAQIIFSALADAGVDFIHVTEHEAWQPAFEGGQDSLITLARKFAPGITIIGNGGLHDPAHAGEALNAGADMIALGRGALSNPDYPVILETNQMFRAFDGSILQPIADIKVSELELELEGCLS